MFPPSRVLSAAVLLGAVLGTGCGRDAAPGDGSSDPMRAMGLAPEVGDEVRIAATTFQGEGPQDAPTRRFVRSGSIRLEVGDLTTASESASALARAFGGYVAGSELREGREGARTALLTLRMPSDSVDALMAALPDLGRVISTEVRAQEVTREYVDLETRLAVKEETVERLRALAARGGTLEELLAAEREVGRAVSELELLEGRMRSLSTRIAEADIRVTLFEPGAVVGSGAFRPLIEAFRDSGEILARSLAALVYGAVFALPWAVVGGALLWMMRRWWRGRRAADG